MGLGVGAAVLNRMGQCKPQREDDIWWGLEGNWLPGYPEEEFLTEGGNSHRRGGDNGMSGTSKSNKEATWVGWSGVEGGRNRSWWGLRSNRGHVKCKDFSFQSECNVKELQKSEQPSGLIWLTFWKGPPGCSIEHRSQWAGVVTGRALRDHKSTYSERQ